MIDVEQIDRAGVGSNVVSRRTRGTRRNAGSPFNVRPSTSSPCPTAVVSSAVDVVDGSSEVVAQVGGAHRHDAAVLASLGQRLPPLDRLLPPHLVLVELGEVVDDDRDGQRDDEHATDAAHAADELPERRHRDDVTVADRRHGDRRPPERVGDARVGLRVVVLLGEVGEAREHEDADGEEHDEETELLVAALQRVAERLKAGRVARQLEYPQDSHDPEDLDDAPHVVEALRALVRLDEAERDEVRHDGQQVNDVERTLQVTRGVSGDDTNNT